MSEQHAAGGNPEIRFEKEDIRATPVLKFLVGIAITSVVVCFLLLAFYRGMRSFIAARQPPEPHMRFEADREPPLPRLQDVPAQDLATFRAEEDETLTSYGWVDQRAGVVRIPIDEAMKLIVEQGLPRTSIPAAGGMAK
jgi:hypothetical protein